ncbi:hypothetical protein P280DRAFT_476737 [Massarina eburnea CBS 473.64]|uniref:F-box domain-containing protein n=1 Tax=Massarina eburnea CBS 473.64 TaxID=1395130 RepID=A0A6A6SES9_9PLEO|nr:hypothetical protein P280DRAFT_476737 [Massarina eburnea CBS 473.64]
MALLALPAELVREILHKLDPESFFTCLQTARIFRQHALVSTNLLRDQLARVPGQRVLPKNVKNNTQALLELFGKRSTQHLLHGVARMADVHVWRAGLGIDRKVSGILAWNWSESDVKLSATPTGAKAFENTLILCEVRAKNGDVDLITIREGEPRLEHLISTNQLARHVSPYHEDGLRDYKVFKVVPFQDTRNGYDSRLRIAILYGPLHDSETVPWRLFVVALDQDIGHALIDICTIVPELEDTFMDMAINIDGNPIIAWRSIDGHSLHPKHYRVAIYDKYHHNSDSELATPGQYMTLDMLAEVEPEALSKMRLQGYNVHLVPPSIPMPRYTARILAQNRSSEAFQRRVTHLPDNVEVFPAQALGRTIATHHHHLVRISDLNNGTPTCVNTALELVITRDRRFHERSRQGAYLLKALQFPDHCYHFDTNEDYAGLNHVFVAKLAGLPDIHNLSSLGLILATSPRAHRIAIASWRTLLIYSLDPQAFLDPVYSLSQNITASDPGDRLRQAGVPGDYAYIEGCGWQFYENGKFGNECVVLKPVKVECKCVVYGLEWRNENELWGWGEEGLVRWRIGAGAEGQRGYKEIPCY